MRKKYERGHMSTYYSGVGHKSHIGPTNSFGSGEISWIARATKMLELHLQVNGVRVEEDQIIFRIILPHNSQKQR